ncbi:hypothetical protein Pyn_08908 [Prunus yedoensis var. nudiflora]|uniref:Uncharacterized protein n=1 Tax=Prunus yedoensis var. nudiflora TaxID=2094558 RepID=A0A314ZEN5_PRUYE|nr:hypothetical protein Pyn_08908 [Prunus yedoensis var. nudiflora]
MCVCAGSINLSDHDFAGSSPADSPSGGAPTSPSAKPKSLCSSSGPVFQGFLHREENCFVYVLQKLIACASAATE